MSISRLFVCFALLFVAALPFGSVCPAEAASSLKYGGQYYPGEFLLQGNPDLWKQAGIEVEHILFSSGSENNQALVSGKIDVNCGSDSKTAALFDIFGEETVVIGIIQKGDRYSTVVKTDSGISSWHDLKGMTVATRLGSGAEQVLRRYFDQTEGLAWDDFRWVNMKIENMASALDSGRIQAFTAWEPTPSIAEARGIGQVMRTYGDISSVPVALHTTKAFAAANRDALVRFLHAHLLKAKLIKDDPQQAAALAAAAANKRGQSVPEAAFLKMFKRIDFDIAIDDSIREAHRNTCEFLHAQGKIKTVPTIIYDESILEDARKLLQD